MDSHFKILDKYNFDVERLKENVYAVAEQAGWGTHNQIAITHPPGTVDWFIPTGPMVTCKNFTEMNKFLEGTYYEEVHKTLYEDYPFTRVRIMKLPAARSLSLHSDFQPRLHIPLVTNEQCMMVIGDQVKHMPADGRVWWTNTVKPHCAFNANIEGTFERLHLLFDLL